MKLKLPDNVASQQDLAALMLEIHECIRWLSHESVRKRASVKQLAEPPSLSLAAQELVSTWGGHQQELEELIKELESYAKSAPTVTVTLAAPAPGNVKTTLVTWCRANIAPNILVSFRFNSTILGGMVVHYDSHVFDWSFRRHILAAKDNFPEVLRRA